MESGVRELDVVVLGAGAAGLMAAMEAGRRGRRVLLVDHAERAGKKILISGGGRSNFTNLHTRAENFLSENQHFARSALARYTPADFIAMVERHGIAYHEKTLGQLFCDRSAHDLVDMLLKECAEAGVEMALGVRVASVTRGEDGGFAVETSAGTLRAESVVIATGGLSIPKIGATGFGYEVARQFGLSVVEPRPALVPLTFCEEDAAAWCDLAGVSAEVVVRATSAGGLKKRARAEVPAFREKMLITHRGLSGPAVLQVSSYWQPGGALVVDLLPGRTVFAEMRKAGARRDRAMAAGTVRAVLPARLADRWMERLVPANVRVPHASEARHGAPVSQAMGRELSNAALDAMEAELHGWRVTPGGTEGFAKAEVTAGGVATGELDPRTLEARAVPGLYFVGEVVDVTGWLGGYNFQWAWASGFCAGQVA